MMCPRGSICKSRAETGAKEFLNALTLSLLHISGTEFDEQESIRSTACFELLLVTKNEVISKKITVCKRGLKQKQKEWNFEAFLISKCFYCHCIFISMFPIWLKIIFHGDELLIQHDIVSILFHLLSISNCSKHLNIRREKYLNHACTPGRLSDEGIWVGKISLAILLPVLSRLSGVKHSPDRL